MEDTNDFSVVKFFKEFQSQLKRLDEYPLSIDNLIVHQDLLKMLGDDTVEFNYPFASVSMDRPRSFSDLLFSLELYASSVVISVDQQLPIEIPYSAFHLSEEKLADALINILVGLANGQIFILTTLIDEDQPQAIEILYQQKDAKLYTVISTFSFFTKKSKASDASYSTELRKNSFDMQQVKIDKKFLEQLLPSSLDTSESNRKPFADLSSPLTRSNHKQNGSISSEIWSNNFTASWFPSYNKNKPKIEKFVAYGYYRYIEVVATIGIAITLLTLTMRAAPINVICIVGILVLTTIGVIYLRKVGIAMWVFGLAAYIASLGYILFFLSIDLKGVWSWIIAILALGPIVEMLIADFYTLSKNVRPIKHT